jgi:hypothetical protein
LPTTSTRLLLHMQQSILQGYNDTPRGSCPPCPKMSLQPNTHMPVSDEDSDSPFCGLDIKLCNRKAWWPTTPNVSKITLIKVSRPKYTNCLGALELEKNCGEDDNSPREDLRGRLDKDEQFLELPELYDLVGVVAERFGLNDSLLLKQYRCQDQVATCKSLLGKSMIRVPDNMDFRPAVVIARQVKIG